MAKVKDVVKFLNNYLRIKEIKDSSRNGLQVKGKKNVSKIAFTENASLDTFEMAKKAGADLIIVHHGILWKSKYKKNRVSEKIAKERMKFLVKNNMALYAVHLPLDFHRVVGNNAQLLKMIKLPDSVFNIIKILNKNLKTKCKALLFGTKKIKTIMVCSGGGGSPKFYEALGKKVDLYPTGETCEVYTSAKEAKFNVIFAGHYATETLGVKALMEVVKKKFSSSAKSYGGSTEAFGEGGKVKTIFIDDPTGL